MNRLSRSLPGVLAIVAIGGAIIFWQRNHSSPPTLPGVSPARSTSATSTVTPQSTPDPSKLTEPAADVTTRLDTILVQLTASQEPKASRQLLADLRIFLDGIAPATASLELQSFLAGSKDAATSLDVTIKPGGALDDASSLRVFLLDYLGKIDRPAAGALAARILANYTTPDEWAVSLRNYAWAHSGPEGEAFLRTKSRELLNNPAWLKNPSAGFLEAFDTIVHARGTALTPDLAAIVRDRENRATAHAAYLTLDRLVISEPEAMLKTFVEQPELMSGREQTRANYIARADVREPGQRTLVEKYLLDPALLEQELATFAGLFPNANYMVSNNLLTQVATPTGADLAKHDAAALGVIDEWLSDPRFEKLMPQLKSMRSRLETFVRQAAGKP